MLTFDQLNVLPETITEVYENYLQSVINDIARRIAKMGEVTPLSAWQMQRLTESGGVYEEALRQLSQITGKSEAELREAMKWAGVKSMEFDDRIYKAAGLSPIPLKLSPAMQQVLLAGLAKTNATLKNLTLTTALSAQASFIQESDLAYMQVSSGAMSYDQAIRAAIKRVADSGLTTIDYKSGHRDQLDVAVRRAVLTGVSQTVGVIQIQRAEEMGVDLVQTSAHAGARNKGVGPQNHESWQGKVFSRSGRSKKYPPFVETTGYGTGEGLMGWNCRHSFFPYFEGISENAYSEAERKNLAKKTVDYGGEKISMYDATQVQRYIERNIRRWKRQAQALAAAGLENSKEMSLVKSWQARMRDFINQTKLTRQSIREQI